MPDNEVIAFEPEGALFSAEYAKRSGSFRMDTDHYHSFYELYILLSGERRYFIRDHSYLIRQGDIVLIGKREVHQTSDVFGSPPHERIVIYFYESLLRQLYKHDADYLLAPFKRRSPVCRLPLKERMQMEEAARAIESEMRQRKPGCELAIRQKLIDLLLLAARHTDRADTAEPNTDNTPLYRKMSEIARAVNKRYAEPLTLELLADEFHISPYYLSRMFKQAVGLPLTEFINITRVKEAELLLKETDMSILDIAAAVGYNNFSHFGKMFKKLTRMSPRDYRKSD